MGRGGGAGFGWRAVIAAGMLLLAACGIERESSASGEVLPASRSEARAIAAHGFQDAEVGFAVYDMEDGSLIALHNADRGFIPASVTKLPTMAVALAVLGSDHRFETRLAATGTVADGVLEGDLFLVGGGDPLLMPGDLLELAEALRGSGIRRITGGFRFDQSALPALERLEAGQPEDAAYNPGLSALSLGFNRFPGPEPSAPEPDWKPVREPGLRTARLFAALAATQGIRLPSPVPGPVSPAARTLATHHSRPLREVAATGLEFSNNLVSELVGLGVAGRLAGRPASLAASAEMIMRELRLLAPNADFEGLRLVNHSGLSAASRVTPRQMALIAVAAHQRIPGFAALLVPLGWNGSRLADPRLAVRIWAKSGTMNYASGLAGYLFPETGRRLAFALFITDFVRRRDFDADPGREGAEAMAEAWRLRAKALEDDLVSGWIVSPPQQDGRGRRPPPDRERDRR